MLAKRAFPEITHLGEPDLLPQGVALPDEKMSISLKMVSLFLNPGFKHLRHRPDRLL